MPYKAKNAQGQTSPFWSISWTDPETGKQKRETTTTTNKSDAKDLENAKRLGARAVKRGGASSVFENLLLSKPKPTATGGKLGVSLKEFCRLALEVKAGTRKGGFSPAEIDVFWSRDIQAMRALRARHYEMKRRGEVPKFKVKTLDEQIRLLFKFFDYFGADTDPSLIEEEDIARYIRDRQADEASGATINRETDAISNAYRYGLTLPEFRRSPVRNPVNRLVHKQAEATPKQRYWFGEERERFLEACDQMGPKFFFPVDLLKKVAVVSWTCGTRIDELLQLQVSQVKLREELCALDDWQTKNHKKRFVKMWTPQVVACFKELVQGKKGSELVFAWDGCKKRTNKHKGNSVEYYSLAHAFEKVCASAGISGVKIHDWRKTAAIDWRVGAYGEPLEITQIQAELQHTDITTTFRYVDESLVGQLRELKKRAA